MIVMWRSVVTVCLLLALAGCATGSGVGDAEIPENAILVVGDFANPPFSSYDDAGEPVGLEVEILAEVGRKLGRPVHWIELPFAEMLPATASGEAHVAASTVGITEARSRSVAFSESYHGTEISVLVRAGDIEPASLADLVGKPVGAGRATTSADAVRRSLPDAVLVDERDDDTTFEQMLLDGEVDALVMDRPAAERRLTEHAGKLLRLDESLGEERYAFAVHPERTEILTAIDVAVRAWRDDGRLAAFAREHGLDPSEVPSPTRSR